MAGTSAGAKKGWMNRTRSKTKKMKPDFTHDELSRKIGVPRAALMNAKKGRIITTNKGIYKKTATGTGATWTKMK